MSKTYTYKAIIKAVPDKGGAYVEFPYDVRQEFGRGRVKVLAKFNGLAYRGSIVNMGVKNPDGSICYIIGVLKELRERMQKDIGDEIEVSIEPWDEKEDEILQYIYKQEKEIQKLLLKVDKAISKGLPKEVERKIAWGMPTYKKRHNIIHFAAHKNHLGIYPGPEVIVERAEELRNYKTSKGAIQFLYKEEIPYTLIESLARYCAKRLEE